MGIVEDIKSQINVYTPIVEAIVNSIEAIDRKNTAGEIVITVHRDSELPFDTSTPGIKSIDIEDNGRV